MTISTILFYAFIAVVSIQVAYYLSFLFSFAVKRAETRLQKNIPISVIICAKNEAENLQDHLPYILQQQYDDYEVIVVNDASTDDTAKVLNEFQQEHTHLRVLTIHANEERSMRGKKYALSKGIEAAKYDLLLLTDADCRPSSEHWVERMQAYIGGNSGKTAL
mgnify:CR=1 FL=1